MKKNFVALFLCTMMLLFGVPFHVSAATGNIRSIVIDGVDLPKAGEIISYDSGALQVADPSLYSVYYSSSSWQSVHGNLSVDASGISRFVGGERYSLFLVVVPKDGVTGLDDSTAAKIPVSINDRVATYDPEAKFQIEGVSENTRGYAYRIDDLRCPWEKNISIVELADFERPMPDVYPATDWFVSVPGDAPYYVREVKWYDYGGNSTRLMEKDGCFLPGEEYFAVITLHTKKGYSFDENITAYANDRQDYLKADDYDVSGTTLYLKTVDFCVEHCFIDVVNVENFPTLYAGMTVADVMSQFAASDGEGYHISLSHFDGIYCDGVLLTYYDKLELGKKYSLKIHVTPKYRWWIDNTTLWYIDGKIPQNYEVTNSSDGAYNLLISDISVESPFHLDAVGVSNVKTPVIGGKVKNYINVVENSPFYDIKNVGWWNETDGVFVDLDSYFEENKLYSLYVTVVPVRSSYAIDENTVFAFNGGAVKENIDAASADGTTRYTVPVKAVSSLQSSFTDVPKGSYYEEAVQWSVLNNITNGVSQTLFGPENTCTRAHAVTFLWRMAGCPSVDRTFMPFTDVPKGSYYYNAVLWAVERNITNGTDATTFSPDDSCTRGQIVMFLWRNKNSPVSDVANPFIDVNSDAYYTKAVLWAVKENITNGTTANTFSPNDICTRGQIVTFLWRSAK